MAAGINDRFTQATNGTRPVPTTLTAIRGVAAGTISCAALTGWPTATAVHFIIYRTDSSGNKVAGSQTEWKGIVSGTTITALALKAGTDLGDSIGAIVEAAPTAAWANDMVAGMTQEHNQDGTHSVVTATSVTGGTLISTGDIQRRSISTETIDSERLKNYVALGGTWTGDSYGASLNGSMTAITYYVNGRRFTIGAVTARAFTASKDTYVDVDNAGVINYTEVANNAASPALSANRIRIGTVVTAAGSIAAATSIGQGLFTNIAPVVGGMTLAGGDSLGNVVYPKGPISNVLTQNPYKFRVHQVGAQNTGAGVATKVLLDTKDFDTSNNFDAVTNRRFVAPVAGYYYFNGHTAANANPGAFFFVALYKNGAEYKRGTQLNSNNSCDTEVSDTIQLIAGDYVELFVFAINNVAMTVGNAEQPVFSGFLVSAS